MFQFHGEVLGTIDLDHGLQELEAPEQSRRIQLPYFTGEETEAQKSEESCSVPNV